MKTLAFGPLGLVPSDFWTMTYGEFLFLLKGYQDRQDREWDKIAWLGRLIVSPHVKNPPSIDTLLGRKKEIQKKTRKEARNEMDWLKERFGK